MQLDRCLEAPYMNYHRDFFTVANIQAINSIIEPLKSSTLWAHLSPTKSNYQEELPIMSENRVSEYMKEIVDEDGSKTTEILEEGIITHGNINNMKFHFKPGDDITGDIDKRNDKRKLSAARRPPNTGRTGYSSMTCIFPDENVTDIVALSDCIIHYRKPSESSKQTNTSTYGVEYVTIGVPSEFVVKILDDAEKEKVINLGLKKNTQVKNNYYWFSTDISKLTRDDVTIITLKEGSDDADITGIHISEALDGMKSSLKCTFTGTISGSMTTNTKNESLDLMNGTYGLGIKPASIIVEDATDIVGPTFADISAQGKKAKPELTARNVASDRLAAFAASKLSKLSVK